VTDERLSQLYRLYSGKGGGPSLTDAEALWLVHNYREIDRSESQLIRERDYAQEWADKLAYAIGDTEVIGEHSNLNCPWEEAYAIVTPAENVRAMEKELAELRAEVTRLKDADRLALITAPLPTAPSRTLDPAARAAATGEPGTAPEWE
jgi:hypothetical protein